jgi:hypothetical protein
VGAELTVTLIERTPPDRPGLNPTNKFSATYKSPSAAATASYFSSPADSAPVMSTATGQPAVHQQPVPGSPAYQAPPAATAVAEPQRPEGIPQAAWDSMDPATRANVAKTFSDMPPF